MATTKVGGYVKEQQPRGWVSGKYINQWAFESVRSRVTIKYHMAHTLRDMGFVLDDHHTGQQPSQALKHSPNKTHVQTLVVDKTSPGHHQCIAATTSLKDSPATGRASTATSVALKDSPATGRASTATSVTLKDSPATGRASTTTSVALKDSPATGHAYTATSVTLKDSPATGCASTATGVALKDSPATGVAVKDSPATVHASTALKELSVNVHKHKVHFLKQRCEGKENYTYLCDNQLDVEFLKEETLEDRLSEAPQIDLTEDGGSVMVDGEQFDVIVMKEDVVIDEDQPSVKRSKTIILVDLTVDRSTAVNGKSELRTTDSNGVVLTVIDCC